MRPRAQSATALALYAALTIVFFFPCLRFLSSALIGPPEDNMFMYWALWYGPRALIDPALEFMRTSRIFYPEGVSLVFCNYYYYGVAIAAVLKPVLSGPLLYNLLVLHTFALAGLGAFWLVRELTGDFAAALAGGFVFAFNPSHFAHSLHHVTIASIQFVPFFALFVIKAARGERRAHLWASLFLVLAALCDWNYLVYGLVFLWLASAWLAVRRGGASAPALIRFFWIHVLAGAALSPLLVPMVWTGLRQKFVTDLGGADTFVSDLAGFFVPHVYHAAASWAPVRAANAAMTGTDWEKASYLGWANLALAAWALSAAWKKNAKYLWALLAFMVLAMGPRPHLLGHALPLPLPYAVFEKLPLLSNARCPSRILVFGYLFLAALVGSAFALLRARSAGKGRLAARALLLAVSAVVFLDFYSVNAAVTPVVLPPAYDAIRKDAGKDFGILELPWDGARYMMYQTVHGIPDVQGYIGRRTERTLANRLPYDLRYLKVQKLMLVANKVKYVVIHKRRLQWTKTPAEEERYRRALEMTAAAYAGTYEKVYEDDDAATFRVY